MRFCHEFVRQNAHAENYLKRIGNLSGFGDEWMKIIGITVRPTDGVSGAGAMLTTKPKRREPREENEEKRRNFTCKLHPATPCAVINN